MTGGEYYRATDRESLRAGLNGILDKLDKSKLLEGGASANYREEFPPFLLAAFVLAGLELLLRSTAAAGVPVTETAWRFTVLGYPVGLGAPEWLLLGLAALVVAAVAAVAALRRRTAVRRLLGSDSARASRPGWRSPRRCCARCPPACRSSSSPWRWPSRSAGAAPS